MPEKPNDGHRQRMLRRFERQGCSFEGFHPHEALEAFLFLLLPRVNTNRTAHLLLDRFGTFEGVFSAPVSELVKIKGISDKTAAAIRRYGEIFAIARSEAMGESADFFEL